MDERRKREPTAWQVLEEKAVGCFDNQDGEDILHYVLEHAAHFANVSRQHTKITVDRRAFCLGTAKAADEGQMERSPAAQTFLEWLKVDPFDVVQKQGRDESDILKAHSKNAVVVASKNMNDIAAEARKFAEQTREKLAFRHFLSAFMCLRTNTHGAQEFLEDLYSRKLLPVEDFQDLLYDRMEEDREPNIERWRRILLLSPPGTSVRRKADPSSRASIWRKTLNSSASGATDDRENNPSPQSSSGATDVQPMATSQPTTDGSTDPRGRRDFTSDAYTTLDPKDPLGLKADVRAFADLICLREVLPPLSIGLFGGWGSGKSTFMSALEGEIDQVVGEHFADGDPLDRDTTYVKHVVHIRFNAWHFADANLWASLTAEFFDQLRAGGYKNTDKVIHSQLVADVGAHARKLSDDAKQAKEKLSQSEKALIEAQKQRQTALADSKDRLSQKYSQTLVVAVSATYANFKADLPEMGRTIDPEQPEKDIAEFIGIVKEVQTWRGQGRTLIRYIHARGWRMTGLFAAVATAAGGALLLYWKPAIWLSVLPILAGLAGIAQILRPGVKLIGSLLRSSVDFAAALQGETDAALTRISQADEALKRAAAEVDACKAAAAKAVALEARYTSTTKLLGSSPKLLRYLLEDDPEAQALAKETGLISRVRRLFQELDTVLGNATTPENAAPEKNGERPSARGGPRPTEDNKDKDEEPNEPVPDRIIIYIDDLDRCTPRQVYEVLQAVHLLLAFKHFVVIVGVDFAWISQALAKELQPSLLGAEKLDDELTERQLAIRYLEKIFQIPFWLRRLTTSSNAGGEGSYTLFVDSLLADNTPKSSTRKSDSTGQSENGGGNAAVVVENKDDLPTEETPQEPSTSQSEFKSEPESELPSKASPKLEPMKLEPEEIKFLKIPAIGRLAGSEPRTVKRFINIYRIVRGASTENEQGRARFLGEGQEDAQPSIPAEYPIAAIMVAIETGQPMAVADALFRAITSPATDNDFLNGQSDDIRNAFKEAVGRRGGAPIDRETVVKWAREARRFSFNKI